MLSLVHERRPDCVVISGDLTQRAKPGQFAAAKRFVDRIPCPTLAVPGNHDVPLYRFWERLATPFGAWRKHFSPLLEPHLVDDEISIVGFNTAFGLTLTGGRITRRQRRRARDLFGAAPPSCYRIAVIHHNLLRPSGLDEVPRPLRGSTPALAALRSAGVQMVLTGHLHQSYVATLPVEDGADGGLILCAGTTTSSRGRGRETGSNTCHWIEIDAVEARVFFQCWDPAALAFRETARRSFPRPLACDHGRAAAGGGQGA